MTGDFLLQAKDGDEPVFREPWEAQAFGLVIALHEQGILDWSEWADALAAEIICAQNEGDADLGNTYYQHWLQALENLLNKKQIANSIDIESLAERWRQAYRHTPHGQPVKLETVAQD